MGLGSGASLLPQCGLTAVPPVDPLPLFPLLTLSLFPPPISAVVEMLKALHSLQKENQRLQEQIMTLTAKKERLQLLNVQLSVPFPVVTTSNGPGSQAQYILPPNGERTSGVHHPLPFHHSAPGWAGGWRWGGCDPFLSL